MKHLITQDELKELLNYDEETGMFTWKKSGKGRKADKAVGYTNIRGYVEVTIKKSKYYGHRLAWLYVYGYMPENMIDHINHNQSDNSIANLREADSQSNARNQTKSKNGDYGVQWSKKRSLWNSMIYVDNKAIYLGMFAEYSDALNARKNAEVLYGFHENHGKDLSWQQ